MTKFFSNFDWMELLLPVVSDLKSINRETNTSAVPTNNMDLADKENEEEYEMIISRINELREKNNSSHNLIIIE
ncbi:MAG: hypothetical protein ACOVOQ_10300 [Flavobacterium sp.]